jgi:hypothetical protein
MVQIMNDIYLKTWLLVPDPTAISAQMALQRMDSLKDKLLSLKRFSLWKLSFTDSIEFPPIALLKGNAYLVNPNKHKYEFLLNLDTLHSSPQTGIWHILVSKPQLQVNLEQLRKFSGISSLSDVMAYEMWELHCIPNLTKADIASMTITDSRSSGLLVNPHFQEITWL